MAKRGVEPDEVEYSLLENGLDFIDSGLTQIGQAENPSVLKYAVLRLGAGIELVLKERVRREDWKLLFRNVAKADEKLYESGNFSSVNLHECLDRLEDAGLDIAPESRRKLESFYDRCNRIQHFQFKETREAVESAAAEVIGIVLDFIAEEFDGNTRTGQEDLQELVEQLTAYVRWWRPNAEGLLFATKNGTPWDHSLVRKRKFHPQLKELNIPRCGFHGFRHGNATLLDRLGVPMAIRQDRLGHADTTMGYTHAVSADERRIAEELGKILHAPARNEQENRPAVRSLSASIQ